MRIGLVLVLFLAISFCAYSDSFVGHYSGLYTETSGPSAFYNITIDLGDNGNFEDVNKIFGTVWVEKTEIGTCTINSASSYYDPSDNSLFIRGNINTGGDFYTSGATLHNGIKGNIRFNFPAGGLSSGSINLEKIIYTPTPHPFCDIDEDGIIGVEELKELVASDFTIDDLFILAKAWYQPAESCGQTYTETPTPSPTSTPSPTNTTIPDIVGPVREVVFVRSVTPEVESNLWAIKSDKTNLRQITDNYLDSYPDISPGGNQIVFLTNQGTDLEGKSLAYIDNNGNNRQILVAKYAAPGHNPSISSINTLVYLRSNTSNEFESGIYWRHLITSETQFLVPRIELNPEEILDPRKPNISGNGQKITFGAVSPYNPSGEGIYMCEISNCSPELVYSHSTAENASPKLIGSATALVFIENRNLYLYNLSEDQIYPLVEDGLVSESDISNDGKVVVFTRINPQGVIYIMNVDRTGEQILVEGNAHTPRIQ